MELQRETNVSYLFLCVSAALLILKFFGGKSSVLFGLDHHYLKI